MKSCLGARVARMLRKLLGLERAAELRKVAERASLFTAGYILSPLSFWNDAFVNIPIAYAAALVASLLLGPSVFPVAFFTAYLATNVAGLLMMHVSIRGFRLDAKRVVEILASSIVYTILATTVFRQIG